ncbi:MULTISPECIES: group II intron reverse transcriptase/maturase [unclassified Microcoleus]|jgi:RNA-directed DNA polymerase|uniref:group II intron reverse transcriptase/maturase n=2 Tax=Microcoleus TaxID=44471 RepID=UPI001D36DAAF|nr:MULTISPECIES: group II intron reverse transcriptase/maturase [unclassified Microcoleus]MCC3422104.1 group II intron reverse transcriptase/maturase [Microcoleus sp. PH2017_07_MST_O_A]MCC3433120.1 group II intron reverse transcriptase/maturase [Microcoleus sp. PH2017_04_SCI_O_A]MCC3445332.1 group II intron reverse transcriptase/maturase [Microcoleus sp. PH2017_03_ELD_O_A]MCC3507476.1 group II intron reverse transcriptase/maturase [Microcoleus sp. PH2017_19_SFW_U_A]MCC3513840.1 group II intron
MSTVKPMYEWNKTPWRKLERVVFKLQKRIYQAANRGDIKALRRLQKLLMKSWAAKCLAVRRVTQDNKGKKTAGVDGVKSLTPKQRLDLIGNINLSSKVSPTRRVWIPKPGTEEKRPLGIPTMKDRALQALVKLALEPEWEARFEPNQYGFRPGRSCQDAIGAIFNAIRYKQKYVLDADIAKCFDKIDHEALLKKLNTFPLLRRQIKAWLRAGVMDGQQLFPTLEGTPQGGVISPLLANIALHGMEHRIKEFAKTLDIKKSTGKGQVSWQQKCKSISLIRYADDFVILHEDLTVVQKCKEIISEWLKGMGLELKFSKTRIAHTMSSHDGQSPGFDFLGFKVRQYPSGKYTSGKNPQGELLGFSTIITPSPTKVKIHLKEIARIIDIHKAKSQSDLIKRLNPLIIGWANYYRTVPSSKVFYKLDSLVYQKLRAWANHRHHKSKTWVSNKYWQTIGNDHWVFAIREEGTNPLRLRKHGQIKIIDHAKVKGESSPYDGNLVYWSIRMGKHPESPKRVTTLLKIQKGKCSHCGLHFRDEDVMEVDHRIPKSKGGKDSYDNWDLLHRHCHDIKTATDGSRGTKSSCKSVKPKPPSRTEWFWKEDMLVTRYE